MKLLNAGCGTHYAKKWVNVDVWESDTTKPDVVAVPGEPYPFEDDTFDAVYLGHVLEHIDWRELPAYLADIRRVAKPGAHVLVVGPDVLKTILRWSEGKEPWEMVLSTMEHQEVNWQPGRINEFWDGATHHWNCYHQRVWDLLAGAGFTNLQDWYERIPNCATCDTWIDDVTGITWPVVGKWFWQFSIYCQA
jgi:SAM-dependent methyltransferase